MLGDKNIEAVHVLTPTGLHVSTTLKAMQAGKHVLVEKPVALAARDIRHLQVAAQKYKRVCMPAHNYIYVPSLQRAKRLISEKNWGK